MSRSLFDQLRPLTRQTLGILFVRCWDPDWPANRIVSETVSLQHASHRLNVQAIRLRPPTPSGDQKAGCIKNGRVDASINQEPGQPKTVVSSFKANAQSDGLSCRRTTVFGKLRKHCNQPIGITTRN
jgi:hypothetical protein